MGNVGYKVTGPIIQVPLSYAKHEKVRISRGKSQEAQRENKIVRS